VIPLARPAGRDARRKISLAARFPYYAGVIARHARQADVVHVPLPGDIPLVGLLVAAALRKRLLARYGGSWAATAQTTLMNRLTRACMRRLAGGRNVMLANGTGPRPPAPGIHWLVGTALSAAELENLSPSYERSLSNPPSLAYVGRLSPEKGVRQLIEALGCLKEEGFRPLPRLSIIGDGPERSGLEALARRFVGEDLIVFTGQLDRQALSARLLGVDFCVQPSLTESLAKAWLDEMAHGLPVLASDVGAAGEAIGRNGERGWLAPPGDVPALASRLREIIGQPQAWAELRRRCRAYVEGRTLEAWAQQIGEICARQWGISLVEGKLIG
jgi:glycosyltransferase involved in cell wall biosynthesis